MKLDLLNAENKKSDVQISETTFGKDFNESLSNNLNLLDII